MTEKIDPNETLQQLLRSVGKLEQLFEDEEHQEEVFGGNDVDGLAELEENTLSIVDDTRKLDAHLVEGGSLPKKWADKAEGGLIPRALLAQLVYDQILDNTATLAEGPPGYTAFYLLGAILKGGVIELLMDYPRDAESARWYRSTFPPEHPVWKHIQIIKKE